MPVVDVAMIVDRTCLSISVAFIGKICVYVSTCVRAAIDGQVCLDYARDESCFPMSCLFQEGLESCSLSCSLSYHSRGRVKRAQDENHEPAQEHKDAFFTELAHQR